VKNPRKDHASSAAVRVINSSLVQAKEVIYITSLVQACNRPARDLKIATGSHCAAALCSEICCQPNLRATGSRGKFECSSWALGTCLLFKLLFVRCVCEILFLSCATMSRICGDLSWEDLDNLGISFDTLPRRFVTTN